MTAATTTSEKPEVMAISVASKLITEAQPFTPQGRVSRPVSRPLKDVPPSQW
jgi:hypothetical protein